MEDLIRWLYLPSVQASALKGRGLLKEVVERSQAVLANSEHPPAEGDDKTTGEVTRVTVGAAQLLKRHVASLEALLRDDADKMVE
jgi:hypothetical protein